jgi:cell division protein FtsW
MAGYLVRRNVEIQSQLSGFLKPMLILGTVAILLIREPDFGATVVVTTTTLGMMFLAGMRLRHFVFLFSLVLGSLAVIAVSAPYRLARLTSFLNPWARPFDTGYQLTQSLIAFGRGGWWGVGLGKSIQKMFYLPEAHTDFLFAVIAEELGLIGMLIVIGLFLLLAIRIFLIGRRAEELGQQFCRLLGLWVWFVDFYSIYGQYRRKFWDLADKRVNIAFNELWWQQCISKLYCDGSVVAYRL